MDARDERCHCGRRNGSCLVIVFPDLVSGVMERPMPAVLIWTVPGVIALGVTGYYLVAVADLLDTAFGVGWPNERPLDRRRKFKVIEGGKAAPREPRCAG